MGLYDKAEQVINNNIRETISRIEGYYDLADGILYGTLDETKKAQALSHINKAYEQIKALETTFTIDSNFVNLWLKIAKVYGKLGDSAKFIEMKDYAFSTLVGKTAKPNNTTAGVISAMGNSPTLDSSSSMLNVYKANNQANDMLEVLPVYVQAIDHYKSLLGTTTPQMPLMYYGFALMFYGDVALIDSSLKEQAVTAGEELYTKIMEIINLYPDNAQVKTQTQYAAAGAYILLGEEKGKTLLDKCNEANKGAIARNILKGMARNNFDTAKTLYESLNPVDATYSNVVGTNGLIRTFVGLGTKGDVSGLANYAIINGDTALAEKALEYAFTKIKEAANYQLSQATPNAVSFISIDITTGANSSSNYLKSYVTYIDNKYGKSGYTLIADCYNRLGNSAKAREVLEAGKDFNSKLTHNTMIKYQDIGTLAYYAKEFGFTDLATSWYNEAANFQLADTLIDGSAIPVGHIISFDVFKAYDEVVLGGVDKYAKAREYLNAAREKTIANYTTDTTEDSNKAAVSTLEYLTLICKDMADMTSARQFLLAAEIPLNKITVENDKKAKVEALAVRYTRLGLIEEAYNKAVELSATIADRYSHFKKISEVLTGNYLDSGKVAISDFDGDGKPDFFAPWATEADLKRYGYVLDDDIDGDGILDTSDLAPYFKN